MHPIPTNRSNVLLNDGCDVSKLSPTLEHVFMLRKVYWTLFKYLKTKGPTKSPSSSILCPHIGSGGGGGLAIWGARAPVLQMSRRMRGWRECAGLSPLIGYGRNPYLSLSHSPTPFSLISLPDPICESRPSIHSMQTRWAHEVPMAAARAASAADGEACRRGGHTLLLPWGPPVRHACGLPGLGIFGASCCGSVVDKRQGIFSGFSKGLLCSNKILNSYARNKLVKCLCSREIYRGLYQCFHAPKCSRIYLGSSEQYRAKALRFLYKICTRNRLPCFRRVTSSLFNHVLELDGAPQRHDRLAYLATSLDGSADLSPERLQIQRTTRKWRHQANCPKAPILAGH